MKFNVECEKREKKEYDKKVRLHDIGEGNCFAFIYSVNEFYDGTIDSILNAINDGKIAVNMVTDMDIPELYSKNVYIPYVNLKTGHASWTNDNTIVVPIDVVSLFTKDSF